MDGIAMMDAVSGGRTIHRPTAPAGDVGKAREAAEAFEAQVLGQMFQLVMKDMPIDDVFGGGPGERIFRDMLTNTWAEETVRAGGIGIADAVTRTLLEAQGEQR